MKKVTKPKVRPLVTGEKFNAKQMEAKAGDLLPRHTASIESVLIVMEVNVLSSWQVFIIL